MRFCSSFVSFAVAATRGEVKLRTDNAIAVFFIMKKQNVRNSIINMMMYME